MGACLGYEARAIREGEPTRCKWRQRSQTAQQRLWHLRTIRDQAVIKFPRDRPGRDGTAMLSLLPQAVILAEHGIYGLDLLSEWSPVSGVYFFRFFMANLRSEAKFL